MPPKARFLLLFGTFLESLSVAIGMLSVLVIFRLGAFVEQLFNTFEPASRVIGTSSVLVVAFIFYVPGQVLCTWVRRKYPVVKSVLPRNNPIAAAGACLQVLGLFGCAGVLLSPVIFPSMIGDLTSSLGGCIRLAVAFLMFVMFLGAGLFLSFYVFRSVAPIQGFEVLPPSESKE